jgi:acyl dehydratase
MSASFSTPIDRRFFEDYVTGTVHEFGTISIDEAAIIRFAREYDPQPFHTDPLAARATPFGGVIASGWHTAGLMMRMVVDHYLSHTASLASPGVDELRWTQPVRPGDRLSVRATVIDTRRSESKPDRGIVRTLFEVLNQRDEVVMSVRATNILKARERR